MKISEQLQRAAEYAEANPNRAIFALSSTCASQAAYRFIFNELEITNYSNEERILGLYFAATIAADTEKEGLSDQSREEFEAIWRPRHSTLCRMKNGMYNIPSAESAWEGWQANEARNAEKIRLLREALDKLARLGNEPHFGNSDGNRVAQEALAATTDSIKPKGG